VQLFVEELEERCVLSSGLNASVLALEALNSVPARISVLGQDQVQDVEVFTLPAAPLSILPPAPGPPAPESSLDGPIPWEPSAASSITVGPDGNLWFLHEGQVGQLNPTTGVIRQFQLPSESTNDVSIIASADGKLWLLGNDHLDQFNPTTGTVQEFPLPAGDYVGSNWGGTRFSVGPDGNIWFSYASLPGQRQSVGEMDPRTGAVQQKEIGGVFPWDTSTTGPDGTVWFLGFFNSDQLCHLYQTDAPHYNFYGAGFAKELSEVPAYFTWAGSGIASTVDGRLWFTCNIDGEFQIEEFDPAAGTLQFFKMAPPTSAPASGATASNDSISATGTNSSAIAGIDFLGVVASFTPRPSILSPGQAYQATIDWGDGTTSSLVLTVAENAPYDVTAGHTYQKAGTYSIKVTIGNYNPANPLGDDVVTVFSTANVDPFNFTM
jgi:streptogramin lyase